MHDPVAKYREFGRMGHQHQRGAVAVAQAEQQIHDRLAVHPVQIARGFIGQQDRRARGGGARQRDALLLAAGHLRRVVVHPRAQPNGSEFFLGPFEGVGMPGQFQRRRHVLQRRHRRNQMKGLEHHPHLVAPKSGQRVLVHRRQVLPQRHNRAGRGLFKPAQKHQQRRFARARRADQPNRLPLLNFQRDTM